MHRSAVALLKMEADLRRALERDEFTVWYQPIVSLACGRIEGFEALMRWNHPERGLLVPAQYIAIAEETGLIVPIGWWVLRHACRQAHEWQQRFQVDPPLWMSVNVSGKLIMQKDFIDRLLELLGDTGLERESLRLELTENVVLDHDEAAVTRLLELRALGIQSSVDDFGTGYSSLSYLQRTRCDGLKIDPAFVGTLSHTGDSDSLVESIIAMGDRLGIAVIAEGVETAEQLARLRHLRCPQGQGFWFSEPLAPEAAEELLASPPRW
jgi:EAL domain-containing protein (putative c-di-GMP-specific phosphodiesterase class I)